MDYGLELSNVILLLNNIEVKGRQNLDYLLACIQMVSQVKKSLTDEIPEEPQVTVKEMLHVHGDGDQQGEDA